MLLPKWMLGNQRRGAFYCIVCLCLFQSSVCKVNGLLNKLSIVLPLGLFFLTTWVHKSSFFFSLPWKILCHTRKAYLTFLCFLCPPSSTPSSVKQRLYKLIPFDPVHFHFNLSLRYTGGGRGSVTRNSLEATMLYYNRVSTVTNIMRKGLISYSFKYSAVRLSV